MKLDANQLSWLRHSMAGLDECRSEDTDAIWTDANGNFRPRSHGGVESTSEGDGGVHLELPYLIEHLNR